MKMFITNTTYHIASVERGLANHLSGRVETLLAVRINKNNVT